MAIREYIELKPSIKVSKGKRWVALFWLVTSTFFNTIMPFIVGVYFAKQGNLLYLLFLLFPILFNIKRVK
jgi:hypothetical protein